MSHFKYLQWLILLLAEFDNQPGSQKTSRLWRAAEKVFPIWFTWTMDLAMKDLPRRRVTAEHVDLLDRMLNSEGDLVAARLLRDRTKFRQAKRLIVKNAKLEGDKASSLHFEWNAAGAAFHEAALATKVLPLKRRGVHQKPVLRYCELCWRTAPQSPYGKFYCLRHRPRPDNTAYKKARRLARWRSPSQEPDSVAFYIL